jgi:ABC-type glycerol-3-phosphate transport system permease component
MGYSFLAYALARMCWSGRGIPLVLIAIIICAHVWLVPQTLAQFGFGRNAPLYWFWFADWLVSAFAIVFLNQTVRRISKDVVDSARLDGCGGLGIYSHVLLPMVRPTLLFLAILTLMANAGDLLATGTELLRTGTLAVLVPNLLFFIVCSLVMTTPLVVIFFLAHKFPPAPTHCAES